MKVIRTGLYPDHDRYLEGFDVHDYQRRVAAERKKQVARDKTYGPTTGSPRPIEERSTMPNFDDPKAQYAEICNILGVPPSDLDAVHAAIDDLASKALQDQALSPEQHALCVRTGCPPETLLHARIQLPAMPTSEQKLRTQQQFNSDIESMQIRVARR